MFYTSFLVDKIPEKVSYLSPLHFPEKEIDYLIFRTSINTKEEVIRISDELNAYKRIIKWTVDLDNWEKVLRIESKNLDPDTIIQFLNKKGFFAAIIEI